MIYFFYFRLYINIYFVLYVKQITFSDSRKSITDTNLEMSISEILFIDKKVCGMKKLF